MLSKDICEKEFERMCENCDIETEFAAEDVEEKKEFDKLKKSILKMLGSEVLVVNEAGNPVYTPMRSVSAKAITFKEAQGSAFTAMGGAPKEQDIKRVMLAMVDFSDAHSVNQFTNMAKRDITNCLTIGTLFLA